MGFPSKRLLIALAAVLSVLAGAGWTAEGGEVVRAKLENGLQVVIVPDPLAPVAAVQVNYLVGSNEAPEGFPGMAHAQEHMMFRGSQGLSAAQLASLIAALGGDFNANTQQTVTQYVSTVPADALDLALHLEAVRMQGVLDSEPLWEAERGAIEQEVAQDLSNPMYVFYSHLLAEIFTGTPYAHDALGTRPSFQKTTGAMLKAFHDSWYAPNNAILVIAGDVDPGRALDQVKELFGPIPSRPLPPRPAVALQPLHAANIELDTDLPYGLAVLSYRMPGYRNPDFAAGQVLEDVLSSQRAELYALVAGGNALFTDFSTSTLPEAGLGMVVGGFPHGEDGSALLAMLKTVIADYGKNGVPPDLVEAAKRHEIADAAFRANSVSGLASEWSQALAVEGRSSPDEDLEAIKTVTAADVDRVAREYLRNETAISALLTPRPSGKPVAATSYIRGRESFAPSGAGSVSLPAWAERALAPPAVPASRVGPLVTTLPNGIRLIVQPETVSPTVSVYGQVKNSPDLQTPKGQEGVDQVLDELFSYGTTTLDRLAFQEALDGIAADVEVGTGFTLRVLSQYFDRGIALLADNLLHPAFPESAFRVVREETASTVSGQRKSPSHRARIAVRKALFPAGDPALRQPTPESVSGLTLEDVKAFHRRVFRPDLTTIVVVGQVTPEEAKEKVEKYFGAWEAAGPKPETDLPPVPPNKPSATTVPDVTRVQDSVTLAQTLPLTRSDPGYYPLQIGNHALTGAFYATRLYRDLREKAGLVYTVESFLDAGKTRSIFGVFYACDPPNVSKARGLVERDLRQMQSELLGPAELQQAKTILLRQIPLSEASIDDIARGLLARSLAGLPLDEPTRAAKRYVAITAEQVRDAFSEWIRPGDLVQVTLGPNPE
jgi:zinc protease